MKIKAEILKEYIIKTSLSGAIPTMNLKFTDSGIVSAVKNSSHVAMTMGTLKSTSFVDYEILDEVFIKNTKLFIELIKTFNDDITISKEANNILNISNEKRSVNIMLAEKKVCYNLLEERKPSIQTSTEIEMEKSFLLRVVADMKILELSHATFIKKGKELKIRVGNKKEYDYIDNIVNYENNDDDIQVGIGSSFSEIVSSLGSKFKIKMGNNVPMVFIDINDYMAVETIVAPFIEREE